MDESEAIRQLELLVSEIPRKLSNTVGVKESIREIGHEAQELLQYVQGKTLEHYQATLGFYLEAVKIRVSRDPNEVWRNVSCVCSFDEKGAPFITDAEGRKVYADGKVEAA